tara:strand:+ start:225 stop:515 length:291 start_codon:yes stop_codon:yes gene_type:complete
MAKSLLQLMFKYGGKAAKKSGELAKKGAEKAAPTIKKAAEKAKEQLKVEGRFIKGSTKQLKNKLESGELTEAAKNRIRKMLQRRKSKTFSKDFNKK